MNKEPTYNSVYEYLDIVFNNKNPSTNDIIKAKKEYRKLYQKQYQKKYQKKQVQISFRITKKKFDEIKNQAVTLHQKPTQFIRLKVLQKEKHCSRNNLSIKMKLSSLIDSLEDAIFQNKTIDSTRIVNELIEIEKQL